MAHIKSTMEMVLARAERLCAESNVNPTDDMLQQGMKAGAAMILGHPFHASEIFPTLSPVKASRFAEGMLRTFFRHIQLPREEGQPWEGALLCLQQMAKDIALSSAAQTQVSGLLDEIRSILSRYLQHRQQVENQLEENFSMHAAQLQQSLAQQTGMKMKVSPRQHPKFVEEWQRVQAQLNEQYVNALNQYKSTITALFGLS